MNYMTPIQKNCHFLTDPYQGNVAQAVVSKQQLEVNI